MRGVSVMSWTQEIVEELADVGLLRSRSARVTPLSGGVSSEIYRIDDGETSVVVKRALAKLRVAADWYADTGRNQAERDYLAYVSAFAPESVPRVLHQGADYFVMEYLGGELRTWKELLLQGDCRPEHATAAGRLLGRIHAVSSGDPRVAACFDTRDNFQQLRLEPYLLATAARHADLRLTLSAKAECLRAAGGCLVHGDFSPKNILVGDGRLIILDCEVAVDSDPAFDLAFLLNHLLLKALYHAPADRGLQALVDAALAAYRGAADLTPADWAERDRRTARLLLMLALSRIDGKSPVEYLATAPKKRQWVREFTRSRLLANRPMTLAQVSADWFATLPGRVADA